jgi:hypothetical protein
MLLSTAKVANRVGQNVSILLVRFCSQVTHGSVNLGSDHGLLSRFEQGRSERLNAFGVVGSFWLISVWCSGFFASEFKRFDQWIGITHKLFWLGFVMQSGQDIGDGSQFFQQSVDLRIATLRGLRESQRNTLVLVGIEFAAIPFHDFLVFLRP